MEIASAIIMLLGGLAMFLYGIELMGDGLKKQFRCCLEKGPGKGDRQCVHGRADGYFGHCGDPKLHGYHRFDRSADRCRCAEPEAGHIHRYGCQHRHDHHGSDHPFGVY